MLIAHAENEESRAAVLAGPLQQAGYRVVHTGTLLIGESLVEEASKVLAEGGPVVICGTVSAVGTGWAHRVVHAARRHTGCLVLPVRMDREAYLEALDWGGEVAEYWEDPTLAIGRLCAVLAERYPHDDRQEPAQHLVATAEERYRSLVLANYDIYDWSGLPQREHRLASSKLELRRLYVPLRVIVESSADTGLDPARLEALEHEREARRGTWASHGERSLDLHSSRPRARSSIGERLAASRRLVVLGDPGSGKSTLLKWIATAYLLRLKSDPDWQDLPDVSSLPDADLLPVMLRCRELGHDRLAPTIADAVNQSLHKLVLDRKLLEPLRDHLLAGLAAGRALLLIDGLDEINEPQMRAAFCEQVERAHLAYPAAPIIVTSRIVGYREMGRRLGRGFEHVRIADLDRSDKDELARRWCALTEPPSRADTATAGLIQDIHSSDRIERLTGNPLLLTTTAVVRRYLGRLPNRRRDLYTEAIQVLLNWRPDIGESLVAGEVLPQLEYIAYTMCQREVQQVRLDELLDLCIRMRTEFSNIHTIRRHDPETFIRLVEERTGLLNEAGYVRHQGHLVGVYEFRHLTFQEYLAGQALARGHFPGHFPGQGVASAVAPLTVPMWSSGDSPRLTIAESWREPIRLCTSACNSSDVDAVLTAIQVGGADEDRALSARPRAILAALCLADEPDASDEVGGRIIDALVSMIDERDGACAREVDDVEDERSRRSDLDHAAAELANSRWSGPLEAALMDAYQRRGPVDRIPVGSVLASVLVDGRDRGVAATTWASDVARALDGPDMPAATRAALSVGGSTMDSGLVPAYRRALIAERLIARCASASPAADAAAWALTRIGNEYEPIVRRGAHVTGIHGRSNEWHLSRVETGQLASLFDGRELGEGVLFSLFGLVRALHIVDALPVAAATLSHPDGHLRQAAALALGALGDRRPLPQLVHQVAADIDPQAREAAARALGWLGFAEARSSLVSALDDSASEVRATAAWALGYFHYEAVTGPLITRLSDPEPAVRRHAVASLGFSAGPAAVAAVAPLIDDPDPRTRAAAANTLGELGDAGSETALLCALGDDDDRVRASAAHALAALGLVDEGSPVARLLADRSARVRMAAVRSVAPLASRLLKAALRDRLADEDATIRANALRALAIIDDPIPPGEIAPHLESDSRPVVAAAADAVAAVGERQLPPRLLEACRRTPTASALLATARLQAWFEMMGGPRPPGLVDLLRDQRSRQDVRLRAAGAVGLCLLGELEGTEALIELDPDADWEVVEEIVTAAAQLDGRAGIEALDRLAGFGSPWIRWQVAERLAIIGGEQAERVLGRLLEDHHDGIRDNGVRAMERYRHSDHVVELLLTCLDDRHWLVRRSVARVLRDCVVDPVTHALLARTGDPHPMVRNSLIMALAGRPPDLVLPRLLELLVHTDASVREAAAIALGRTRQEPALTLRIEAMLHSPDTERRLVGVHALPLRERPDLIDLVVRRLDDEDHRVRRAALRSLHSVAHLAAEARFRSSLLGAQPWQRELAMDVFARARGLVDRRLLSRDLGGFGPYRSPTWPVTAGWGRLAAFGLMLPVEEVRGLYEALAAEGAVTMAWT